MGRTACSRERLQAVGIVRMGCFRDPKGAGSSQQPFCDKLMFAGWHPRRSGHARPCLLRPEGVVIIPSTKQSGVCSVKISDFHVAVSNIVVYKVALESLKPKSWYRIST